MSFSLARQSKRKTLELNKLVQSLKLLSITKRRNTILIDVFIANAAITMQQIWNNVYHKLFSSVTFLSKRYLVSLSTPSKMPGVSAEYCWSCTFFNMNPFPTERLDGKSKKIRIRVNLSNSFSRMGRCTRNRF